MGFIGSVVSCSNDQLVFLSFWLVFFHWVPWFCDISLEPFAAERPNSYLIYHQQCVSALRRITVLIVCFYLRVAIIWPFDRPKARHPSSSYR
ncbi:hypothetical protein IW262DRAFT_914139 [Armillaria fumosa]|nr:hypothetical protein IW262DRAFT_914139 [Armillaria fumosa]